MQKIRLNFRNVDSSADFNEHFLALGTPGIKSGFAVTRGTGLDLLMSPGILLTQEGVSIMETEETVLEMTQVPTGMKRMDIIVATYVYAEAVPTNTCTYSIFEGEAVAENPEWPDIDASQDYPLAYILLQSNTNSGEGFTEVIDIEQNYSTTRIDLSYDAAQCRVTGFEVGLSGNHFVITADNEIVINKIPSMLESESVAFPTHDTITAAYITGMGLGTLNMVGTTLNRMPSRAYMQPITPGTFDPSTITAITIQAYLTSAAYDANQETTIVVDPAKLKIMNPTTKKIYLPCQDVFGIKSINIQDTVSQPMTIGINTVIVLAVITTNAIGTNMLKTFVDFDNYFFYDEFENTFLKRRCIPIAILDGEELTPIRTVASNMIFGPMNKNCGMLRLYHFLGHKNFSVQAIDLEPTEHYNTNVGVTDFTGPLSLFKSPEYASVFYTGSDSTKQIECSIYCGGK